MSGFFKEHYPDIKLAAELEKDLYVKRLAASGSFAETHSVITRLRKLGDFTASQINNIIEACITNTQINWIIEDERIRSFFESLIASHEKEIEEDYLKDIYELLHL